MKIFSFSPSQSITLSSFIFETKNAETHTPNQPEKFISEKEKIQETLEAINNFIKDIKDDGTAQQEVEKYLESLLNQFDLKNKESLPQEVRDALLKLTQFAKLDITQLVDPQGSSRFVAFLDIKLDPPTNDPVYRALIDAGKTKNYVHPEEGFSYIENGEKKTITLSEIIAKDSSALQNLDDLERALKNSIEKSNGRIKNISDQEIRSLRALVERARSKEKITQNDVNTLQNILFALSPELKASLGKHGKNEGLDAKYGWATSEAVQKLFKMIQKEAVATSSVEISYEVILEKPTLPLPPEKPILNLPEFTRYKRVITITDSSGSINDDLDFIKDNIELAKKFQEEILPDQKTNFFSGEFILIQNKYIDGVRVFNEGSIPELVGHTAYNTLKKLKNNGEKTLVKIYTDECFQGISASLLEEIKTLAKEKNCDVVFQTILERETPDGKKEKIFQDAPLEVVYKFFKENEYNPKVVLDEAKVVTEYLNTNQDPKLYKKIKPDGSIKKESYYAFGIPDDYPGVTVKTKEEALSEFDAQKENLENIRKEYAKNMELYNQKLADYEQKMAEYKKQLVAYNSQQERLKNQGNLSIKQETLVSK